MVALKPPEIGVEGMTSGPANIDTRCSTLNTLRIVEMAGLAEIPVAEGRFVECLAMDKTFEDTRTSTDKAAAPAYWVDWKLPPPQKAHELTISTIRRYPGEVRSCRGNTGGSRDSTSDQGTGPHGRVFPADTPRSGRASRRRGPAPTPASPPPIRRHRS